jgi:hypothetical protein
MTRFQGEGIDSDSPVFVSWNFKHFVKETRFLTALLVFFVHFFTMTTTRLFCLLPSTLFQLFFPILGLGIES